MIKKCMTMFLVLIMFSSIASPVSATQQNGIKVLVFGSAVSFDVQPVLENGRVLVPVRQIAEALDADVTFNDETETVTLQKGSYTVSLQIGSSTATKTVIPSGLYTQLDTSTITIDVPAKVYNGRTMVPVRFIAESFDIDVNWNSETNTVNVGMYLVDAPSRTGWKILKGHKYENEGVLYVKMSTTSDGYTSTEFDYEDLLYDHSEVFTWTDGEKYYQTTRDQAFTAISELSAVVDSDTLENWFGNLYYEWVQWSQIADELSHAYERYLNSIDPEKYAITGTNLNDTYGFAAVKVVGVLDNTRNSVFAYFGDTMEEVSEWCGDPISTEKYGMAAEEGTAEKNIQYMTVADYGPYSLDFVDDIMVGFSTDTTGFGNDQVFVGDSIDKIYNDLYVDPKDPTAHQDVYGLTRIHLNLVHESGCEFKRITEAEAVTRDDYYSLDYYYDANSIITRIEFY